MMIGDRLTAGRESRTHMVAKDTMARMCTDGPGYIMVSALEGGRWSTYRMDVTGCKVLTECSYPTCERVTDRSLYVAKHGCMPKMIFDVGLIKDGKCIAAFELSLTHWIDEKKAAKIRATDIIVIEVHAYHDQWMVQDLTRIECQNLFLPMKPAIPFRRLRVGEIL